MKKISQTEWIAITLAIIIVFIIFYLFVPFRFSGGGNTASPDRTASSATSVETEAVSEVITDSGLGIKDTVIGDGEEAVAGKILTVHYAGRLTNGTQFDSSFDRGVPFAFLLGQGSVIRGWDEGLMGMRVGGRRTLTIPAQLGYGASGTGSIPPNSTLIFDVLLLDVRDQEPVQ